MPDLPFDISPLPGQWGAAAVISTLWLTP